MKKKNKNNNRIFILFPIAVILVALVVWYVTYGVRNPYQGTRFGATFSTKYSQELGLDWQNVYTAALDDLELRLFRIPVYWDEIESAEGQIILDNIHWMMDEAEKRDADVILAIGARVPRWPECHPPEWTANMPRGDAEAAELQMITRVVEEFKDHPALYRWQVHNEPYFAVFGECPPPNEEFIASSIQHVRDMDPNHPIMTTDSGELSTWHKAAGVADVLGISMYRVTWNSLWGYFYYPLNPGFYTARAELVEPFIDQLIVSELQAEPWVPTTMLTTPLDEQYRSMNPRQLKANVQFAGRVGLDETLLWGIEWWYWLRQVHSEPEMWDLGKAIFAGEVK